MANARHSLRTGIVTRHGRNTEELLMQFGLERDEIKALTASGAINAYRRAARLSSIKQKKLGTRPLAGCPSCHTSRAGTA
ncbi:MAG: hypothetical protein KUG65_04430 [Sphingomonadaceae bacterium]|nr:hypothetical protein [Sphingomonadaceae bacterium]